MQNKSDTATDPNASPLASPITSPIASPNERPITNGITPPPAAGDDTPAHADGTERPGDSFVQSFARGLAVIRDASC